MRHGGLSIAALALAISLAAGCQGSAPGRSTPPPSERKVFLIGLDGADWKVLRPLLERGRLPNLARLMREGTSGDLQTFVPALSPIIWTSIATGTTVDKHQIAGFWHPAPAGEAETAHDEEAHQERLRALGYIGGPGSPKERMILYRSTDRKEPALWNILAGRRQASDVLAWWVTYPAESIPGVMVSDRYLYNRFVLVAHSREMPYETSDGLVSPAGAEERLRSHVVPVESVAAADLARFIDGEVALGPDLSLHAVEDELRIAYAKDESVVRMARALLAESVPRLLAVYIQGTDIASHYFWKYRFPEDWERKYPGETVAEEGLARYGRVIDAYYERQDENLGAILSHADAATTVIVCSDHGFVTGKRPPGTPGAAETISGVHEDAGPAGVLIMAGSGVRRGAALAGARIYDIAPTVLSLLGEAVPAHLDGRVLREALEPDGS